MDTWSLPKARPISCNDCAAFQPHHMSIRWFAESFTLLLNLINTTFREKIYTRWCCIDRLSWQGLSECGPKLGVSATTLSIERANTTRLDFRFDLPLRPKITQRPNRVSGSAQS